MSKILALRTLSLAALLAASGASQAALTFYNNAANFNAAVLLPGVDTFTGFSTSGVTLSPITRTAGAYGYTASTPGDFYGASTAGNTALSTNIAFDTITFSNFTGSPTAIGASFYGSNLAGAFLAGTLTLVATDSLGATSIQVITPGSASAFFGFGSNVPIISLTVTATQTASSLWPTVDNLTLAVPEPGTYAMMLAGLAAVGFIGRRRRAI
jgi:hypothetical protein